MPRIKFHPWQKGLWLTGDKHTTPEGALRRSTATHGIPRPTIKSRAGSLSLFEYGPGTPHSLYRFNNKTIAGVSTGVFVDGSPGLYFGNGNRLAFVKAPATLADTDLLYIAGGGILEYMTPAGQFFGWGVPAPRDGARAKPGNSLVSSFGDLGDFTKWAPIGAPNAHNPIDVGGTVTRLLADAPLGTVDTAFPSFDFDVVGDFTFFVADNMPSLEGDYIELNIIIETPATTILHISFDCTDGTFVPANAIYSRSINFQSLSDPIFFQTIGPVANSTQIGLDALVNDSVFQDVLRSFGASQTLINDFLTQLHGTGAGPRTQAIIVQFKTTPDKILAVLGKASTFPADSWIRIRLPKNSFGLNDPLNTGAGWSTVKRMRIGFEIGAATGAFGAIQVSQQLNLVGGYAPKGTYEYRFTFRNKVSGARSNPNPAHDGITPVNYLASALSAGAVTLNLQDATEFPSFGIVHIDRESIYYTGKSSNTLTGLIRATEGVDSNHSQYASVAYVPEVTVSVDRQPILLDQIPLAPDSDYEIEIWRTIAANAVFFLNDTIPWNQSTYTDITADPGAAEHVDRILGIEVLPLDNDLPSSTFNDAIGPHQGRMWWGRDSSAGNSNKVYFSPSGRYEAVEDFLIVTHTEDTVQKLVMWNGSLWAFTKHRVIQITGDTTPFSYQWVAGAPGTRFPFSVIATPAGIVYFADDGLRLFTGQESQLVGWEALWPLFRKESVEGIPAFPASDTVVAASTPSEVYLSDETTTLAFNLLTGTWRNLGIGLNAMYYDPQTSQLLGGYAPHKASVVVEDPTTVLDNEGGSVADGLPFEVETISAATTVDATILAQRIYIEANCNGEKLRPVLILDSGIIQLPTFTGTTRQSYEWSLNKTCKILGVRIVAATQDAKIFKPVEIFRVEADSYEGTTE
jgi:hypothetical protein